MPKPRFIILSAILGLATTVLIAWTLSLLVAVNKWNGSPITQAILGPAIYASASTAPAEGEPSTGSIRAWHRAGRGGALTGVQWIRESDDPKARPALLHFLSIHTPGAPLLESMHQLGSQPYANQSRGYFRFGWPFLALSKLEDRNFAKQRWSTHWTIRVPPIFGNPRDEIALPCRPLWPGFLANTAIYTCLWCILLFMPFSFRRHLRLRRGHCPRYNYDLRSTPADSPCPECGTLR